MKIINALRSKYWKGTSEVDEEQELKRYFHENEKIEIEDEYFNYLENKRNEKLTDFNFDNEILELIDAKSNVKSSIFQKINWQVAATIVLFLTIGSVFTIKHLDTRNTISQTEQLVLIDTYDDPQLAYEETKKAILLISSKLNKGKEYTSEIEKFNQAQEGLKN